jgi:hypothetical protein
MVPLGAVPRNLSKAMAAKVDSEKGRRIYPQRLAVVEPVFANIRFRLRYGAEPRSVLFGKPLKMCCLPPSLIGVERG